MYYIGIDLGTGSLESILLDKNASIIDKASSAYPLFVKNKGYAEQDPQDWKDALKDTFETLRKNNPKEFENVSAISIAGQMHSLVMLDENGNLIRDAILWNDTRTSLECIRLNKDPKIQEITKNRALEGFTLPKLLWVQKNETENFKKMASFLLPKDYLTYYLTNEMTMDYSDASGTLLLDFENKKWSDTIFDNYEIPKTAAPTLKEATETIGKVTDIIKDEFGFKKDVFVFGAGADNAVSSISSNALDQDTGVISIGTSGVIITNSIGNTHNDLHTFYHSITNEPYQMGVTLSAGNSLKWFHDCFEPNLSMETLTESVGQIPVGSNGLLYTPYIMGERVPHFDPNIRGSFIGIDVSHTQNHFVRAIMEGVVFSLKDSLEIMKEDNILPKSLISVGGGAKNKDWVQMQADILNLPIKLIEKEEGVSYGAGLLAIYAMNRDLDLNSWLQDIVQFKETIYPNSENVSLYEKYYDVYKSIYTHTKEIAIKLNEIQI